MDSKALEAWAKPWAKSSAECWPLCAKSGAGGKKVHWFCGKETGGLGPRREIGRDIVTQLSFRIALVSCVCLTSKVPGYDPVW